MKTRGKERSSLKQREMCKMNGAKKFPLNSLPLIFCVFCYIYSDIRAIFYTHWSEWLSVWDGVCVCKMIRSADEITLKKKPKNENFIAMQWILENLASTCCSYIYNYHRHHRHRYRAVAVVVLLLPLPLRRHQIYDWVLWMCQIDIK